MPKAQTRPVILDPTSRRRLRLRHLPQHGEQQLRWRVSSILNQLLELTWHSVGSTYFIDSGVLKTI